MHDFYEKVTVCDACRALLGLHVHEKGLKTPLVCNTLPVNLYRSCSPEPPSLTLPPFLTTFVLRPQPATTFNHAEGVLSGIRRGVQLPAHLRRRVGWPL